MITSQLHSVSLLKLSILLAFGHLSAVAWAGAVTDGTVGPVQNLNGSFVVPQNLGTTKGSNLFHSFKNFNIESGESATFTTTTALQNVIARVTGGSASNINGLLKLSAAQGSQPHFYFINPAGVIFGAGAAVDVPAGLHISTADYVKFADGNFYVDTAKASTLSAAAPEAFGFLGNNSTSLEFRDGASLSLRAQQSLTLAAGDISINDATILAPGATVRLAAVGKNKVEAGFYGDFPKADGSLSILNGGSINTTVSSNVDGNLLRVQAGQILIDAQDSRQLTGIFSNAKEGNGKSGDMLITASQQLSIQNGGRISSSTFTAGNAGAIKIDAGAISMDGQGRLSGIFSQSNEDTGHAGNVDINVAGKLAILNGALVSSSTYTAGNGGNVRVTANEIVLDGADANGPSTGFLSTTNNGTGNAGNIEVTARGKLSVLNSAQISTATYSAGQGADIRINAAELLINGNAVSTGINSVSGGAGNAGNLNVNISGATSILSEGGISTSAFDVGQAGKIKFVGNSLHIDGQGVEAGIYSDAGDFRTSASFRGGNGGDIDVSVAGNLSLTGGGRISSTTYTRGNSGAITVAANTLSLDGDRSGIMAETIGVGNAGSIAVKANQSILVQGGARISSATRFVGNGGSVTIDAASLDIDGKGLVTGIYSDAGTQAQGNAGNVGVNINGDLSLKDGGQISSSTISYTTASAGAVKVNAASIKLDGKMNKPVKDDDGNVKTLNTGIFSSANAGDEYTSRSVGNAGTVNVTAKQLQMSNAAQISSSAYARGKAGEVNVNADKIKLASNAIISSEAGADSSGYTGNINIKANESLDIEQGLLSIRNAAQVSKDKLPTKTLLSVDAPDIKLQQAQITASASANVAASDIQISYTNRLLMKGSAVNTSAFEGNGGAISIKGNGALVLERSQITTSVTGTQADQGGNGGDISIAAPAMILRSGFVQANTAAKAASGGNVNIQVNTTIASGNQLVLGGPPQKFDGGSKNLIQAAAPDGVNGIVRLSSPQVDFSASLLSLTAQPNDLGDLLTDLCRVGGGSSLSTAGRGGLLPSSTSLLRP